MTGPGPESAARGSRGEEEAARQRARRRAEVFGEVLPETTRDDREPPTGDDEEWLRANVPPHHG